MPTIIHEYKEYMIQKYKEFYENNKDFRKEILRRLDNAQREYWAVEENRKNQS